MDEQVLVFPARLLDEAGPFEGFTPQVERYLPIFLHPDHLLYLPRSIAEQDPSHKQLVPYVILQSHDQVFCYTRSKKGSEERLHDRWSLGVGGHICQEDGERGIIAYEAGFARELAEEVEIRSPYQQQILGLVYDPSTPVGQVHVGIVHLFTLQQPLVQAVDPALAHGHFRPISEVIADKNLFETWSTLVIEHLWAAKGHQQ